MSSLPERAPGTVPTPASEATTTSGARRWWDVLLAITQAEIREDRDLTFVGFLKWLLEPITYMATYVLLVGVMLRRGAPDYPLFVFCAVLPWQLFQSVVPGSMGLVSGFSGVIGNRAFPRGVLPASLLLKELTTFVLGLVLFVPLMIIFGVAPTWSLLWMPVIVAVLALLCIGPAHVAAVFGVYFPDFRSVVSNLFRVGFLASTALVRPRLVPGKNLPRILKANPLSGIFTSFRRVVLHGQAPRRFDLIYPSVLGAVLLVIGVAVYRWRQDQFAKEL